MPVTQGNSCKRLFKGYVQYSLLQVSLLRLFLGSISDCLWILDGRNNWTVLSCWLLSWGRKDRQRKSGNHWLNVVMVSWL